MLFNVAPHVPSNWHIKLSITGDLSRNLDLCSGREITARYPSLCLLRTTECENREDSERWFFGDHTHRTRQGTPTGEWARCVPPGKGWPAALPGEEMLCPKALGIIAFNAAQIQSAWQARLSLISNQSNSLIVLMEI